MRLGLTLHLKWTQKNSAPINLNFTRHMKMNAYTQWAIAVKVTNELTYSPAIDYHFEMPDPSIRLQEVSRNRISSCNPREYYSDKLFTNPASHASSDFLPIDIMYGHYNPLTCEIVIYVKALDRDKALYGATFEDFLYIIRLHEYAHALVHLGIRQEREEAVLFSLNEDGITDWYKFLEKRSATFALIDESSHEFLAQALTYAAILSLEDRFRDRLLSVFHRLEARQPVHYHLASEAVKYIRQAKWDIILDAARGDINSLREDSFELHSGLQELLCVTGGKEPLLEAATQEWVVQADDEMSASLKQVLLANEPHSLLEGDSIQLLVDRFCGLKIEIFANEHPPPHFRVLCGDETANYRIDDCEQINGGLRIYSKQVKQWHRENRQNVIDAWNRHRPTDCPVGEFRSTATRL